MQLLKGDSKGAIAAGKSRIGLRLLAHATLVTLALPTSAYAYAKNDTGDKGLRQRNYKPVTLIKLESKNAGGYQGNNASGNPSLSRGGRYIAFTSLANNLAGNRPDQNGFADVFLRDTQTGHTDLLSLRSDGTQVNYDSLSAKIAQGFPCIVTFVSQAPTLTPNDNNDEQEDVFLRDWCNQRTSLISSKAFNGAGGNAASTKPAISADGCSVVFQSDADNLLPNPDDTNDQTDIYLKYRCMIPWEPIYRVSLNDGGAQANGPSTEPSVSGDGCRVAFTSEAINLVPSPDRNQARDVFVRDRCSTPQSTIRVSVTEDGGQFDGAGRQPSISNDGCKVAFTAPSPRGYTNVFVRDICSETTELVSTEQTGNPCQISCSEPSISPNGNAVAFVARDALLAQDHNRVDDVYLKNLASGVLTLISKNPATKEAGNGASYDASVSDNQAVGFSSLATDLTLGQDANGAGVADVFRSFLDTRLQLPDCPACNS